MVSQYAAAWSAKARQRLTEAQGAIADFDRQCQEVIATLDALVERARTEPAHADDGLVHLGVAATLRDFDTALLELVSLDQFRAYSQLRAIEEEFGNSSAGWSPAQDVQNAGDELERLVREVQTLQDEVNDVSTQEVEELGSAKLDSLFQSAQAQAPLPPARPDRGETPMLFIPKEKRADRLKLAAWMIGISFLFALSGSTFFVFIFIAIAVFHGAAFVISSQADEEELRARTELAGYADGLKARMRGLNDHARGLLRRLVADMESRLDDAARYAAQASAAVLQVAEGATHAVPGPQDVVFGTCAVSPVVATMARSDRHADFQAFLRADVELSENRIVVANTPRPPLARCFAHMPLRECDHIALFVSPEDDASQVATTVAAAVLRASRPGRARFMFVEPGRLAEAYRVFGALNDSAATRLAERLYITHLSEVSSAVDALRTFVGRAKEAMTRRGDLSRRIDDGDDGGLFLQRAVVVIDHTQSAHWPEQDKRRLNEHMKEIEALAQVGAREGSVLLVQLRATQDVPLPLTTDRLVAMNAIGPSLMFQGHVLVFRPESQSPAEIGAQCDMWAKNAKSADSDLRQTDLTLDWSDSEASDSRYGLEVEIGRHGTDRPARLVLGREGGHHAICIGRTGSGKTNLFHVVISNLVRRYSPDELELYLLDFKEGVEFSVYAELRLPHCKAVAIDADRGFGLSVLMHLKRELNRRASIFKNAGVGITSLEKYEVATGENMPRIVLLIDEFQVLLQPGERLAGAAPGAAASVLEDLVRRGRSFGLHVILGSQTLAGRELTAATLGQLAVRIVLPCSAPDAATLLGEQPISNQLRGPGDAVVWLAGQGDVSDAHLAKIFAADLDDLPALAEDSRRHAAKEGRPVPVPFVFRGSGQSELAELLPHLETLKMEQRDSTAAVLALGAPTSFGERPAGVLRNARGRNVLLVHRTDETRADLLYSALESLLILQPDLSAVICDYDGSEDFQGDMSARLAAAFDGRVRRVEATAFPVELDALAAGVVNEPAGRTVIAIAGAGRSSLARSPALASLLKEGPERGLHVIASCDSVRNLERFIDRPLLAEFGIRALGPASGGDSQKILEASDAETLTAEHQYLCWDDSAPGRLTRLQVLSPALAAPEAEPVLIAEVSNA